MKLSEALEWLGRTDGLYLYGRPGDDGLQWVVGCNNDLGDTMPDFAVGLTPLSAILAARHAVRQLHMDPKKGAII